MSVVSPEERESLNKAHLLKFLEEVKSMEEDTPAVALPPGQINYVDGVRVRVDSTDIKLQDSLNNLRISFACVVQTIFAYMAGVLKTPATPGKTWIHEFNHQAKDLYNMSMHKRVPGKHTITERFMNLLFVLFGYPFSYSVRFQDPDNMRGVYLQNAEFQKHLKLVAKYLKRGIMQWTAVAKNAAQLQSRDETAAQLQLRDESPAASGPIISVGRLTVDAHLQQRDANAAGASKVGVGDLSTVDLLLDFKALCNKL
jgi:hypothetical protein